MRFYDFGIFNVTIYIIFNNKVMEQQKSVLDVFDRVEKGGVSGVLQSTLPIRNGIKLKNILPPKRRDYYVCIADFGS